MIAYQLDKFEQGTTKLLISGICGAGKSTLAKEYSDKYDIPLYRTDFEPYNCEIMYIPLFKKFKDKEYWRYKLKTYRAVHKLLKEPGQTIIEGISIMEMYYMLEKSRDPILSNSIILLDTPLIKSTVRGAWRDRWKGFISEPFHFFRFNLCYSRKHFKFFKNDLERK